MPTTNTALESAMESAQSMLNGSIEDAVQENTSLLDGLMEQAAAPEAGGIEATNYEDVAAKKAEQQRLIAEHNKRVMQSPEYKAIVVYNNFIKSASYIMTGPQKRKLYRECLRNAKKGKYDYLFDEEKIRKREERERAKFEKLNKPVIHTADDVPDEMKERLQALAESDEWKTVKPDEAL